jgi:ankyrin repeat protein
VLGLAAPYASYELASRLIAKGADVHAQQEWHEVGEGDVHNVTALHLASGSWNFQFIRALVEHHGDIGFAQAVVMADSKGRFPLHWALLGLRSSFDRRPEQETICEGLKVVRLLLEANPDTINVHGLSGAAFNFAVAGRVYGAGQLALVKLLIDIEPHPSTLNARDQSGGTALLSVMKYHEGCRWSHEGYFMPLTDLLLSHGADRSLYDNKGQTVLHKLASSPTYNEDICPHLLYLLIPYVNINQTDANGWTALHFMARNLRQVESSRLLISRGANASAINKKGNTVLHEVMGGRLIRRQKEDGSLEWPTLLEKIQTHDMIISILQEAGASMNQPNVEGKTPAQLLVDKRARWEKGGE